MEEGTHHDVNGRNEIKVAYDGNLYERMRGWAFMLILWFYLDTGFLNILNVHGELGNQYAL